MAERQRRSNRPDPWDPEPEAGQGGGDQEALRHRLDDLLGAADRVIDELLSGDSETFLQENVQEGGQ